MCVLYAFLLPRATGQRRVDEEDDADFLSARLKSWIDFETSLPLPASSLLPPPRLVCMASDGARVWGICLPRELGEEFKSRKTFCQVVGGLFE